MTETDLAARLDAALARRSRLLARGDLDCVRLVNGAGDRLPGLFVDRLGPVLIAAVEPDVPFGPILLRLLQRCAPSGIFLKRLRKDVRTARAGDLAPELVHRSTEASPGSLDEIVVREGELRFLVRPREGYSYGLFLDQRDNRARLARLVADHIARSALGPALGVAAVGCNVLNLFAYTCSFSIAAARAGTRTTSVDLSDNYLAWARRNFELNDLEPSTHEFSRGDALTFLQIAAKKSRRFDFLILDPPTYSTSKRHGTFRVERDYSRLAELAARVAAPAATLLCSHNQRTLGARDLTTLVRAGTTAAGRRVVSLDPFAPPSDFPGAPATNPAARGCWVTLD